MQILQGLAEGFSVALDPINLLYVFIGVSVGTLIGAIPGLGPSATIAILLPISFALSAESAIIMLAGIYYGAMYGGRISSILLNLPGDAAAVVTTFDGYPMAQQGRAGPALTISAVASFVGGTIAVIILSVFAPLLANVALQFGPPEIVALTTLGVLLAVYLGTKSVAKSLVAAGAGLLLSSIGQDLVAGTPRLTFGSANLLGGLDFVAVVMGIFGLGEVLYNLEHRLTANTSRAAMTGLWPTAEDWVRSRAAMLRGSILGLFIGMLPGAGAEIASMASYAAEKRRARDPERFGKGAIEGLVGPESANNAGSIGAFIPLLTLGIPGSVTTALLFGALLLQGITPGPTLVNESPGVFYGVIASMYIGNLMLLILNVPLVKLFVQVLRLRLSILAPLIVTVVMVGVYSLNNAAFDMWVLIVFGIVGYLARKTGFSMGPLALTFVLGPIMENAFRRSLLISNGSLDIFVTRPISAAILCVVAFVVLLPVLRSVWNKLRRTE